MGLFESAVQRCCKWVFCSWQNAGSVGSQRMVTSKHAVQALGPNLDGSVVTNQVLPVLTMLSEDSDADVQFFAIQAMAGFTP